MFHSETLNNKIDRFLDNATKIVYSKLLDHKHELFSIHHKNVWNLAVQMYRFLLNLFHSVMSNIPSNYPF